MGHVNMTKCLNCGYERQPKDEGIIPPTECPKCGIIYDKAVPLKNETLSHGPKQTEGDGREIKKAPTYLFQNIIIVLLTAPAFALFMALVIRLASLKLFSWWLMSGIIAFIIAGTILSLSCARKVRHMAVSGQTEEGFKYAKRVNKYFLCVLVITWILGIFIGACGPNYIAYRSRGYDAMAKNDLKNFYIASQKYFQKNPDRTIDVESAKQYSFKPTDDIKLEIQKGQRVNFSTTASHPNGTEMYTINSEGEIIGVKQEIPGR